MSSSFAQHVWGSTTTRTIVFFVTRVFLRHLRIQSPGPVEELTPRLVPQSKLLTARFKLLGKLTMSRNAAFFMLVAISATSLLPTSTACEFTPALHFVLSPLPCFSNLIHQSFLTLVSQGTAPWVSYSRENVFGVVRFLMPWRTVFATVDQKPTDGWQGCRPVFALFSRPPYSLELHRFPSTSAPLPPFYFHN